MHIQSQWRVLRRPRAGFFLDKKPVGIQDPNCTGAASAKATVRAALSRPGPLLGLLGLLLMLVTCRAQLQAQRVAGGDGSKLTLYVSSHPAMGTVYSLYIYASTQAQADEEANSVYDELDRLEDLLSNYKDTSELSRINREAGSTDVTTDPETFRFLQTSLSWSARSNGAFDITVGKLMKAWGFFRSTGHRPSAAELLQVSRDVGWKKVQLNAEQRTVHFLSPGVELDPGGIGNGYAIERAADLLRSEHVTAALLSAGSSTIYALGAPPGEAGWKVRVPALGVAANTLSTVVIRDTSLSTANCSEKHFIEDNHLYCHIMGPHTLQPVEGMLQVTVIAPSATDSDALSNVFFVSNADQSRAIFRTLPAVSALIISGSPSNRHCELLGWKEPIESGYCTAATAKGDH